MEPEGDMVEDTPVQTAVVLDCIEDEMAAVEGGSVAGVERETDDNMGGSVLLNCGFMLDAEGTVVYKVGIGITSGTTDSGESR